MRVTIADAVADQYQELASQMNVTLDHVVDRQLARFSNISPGRRVIVLSEEQVDWLDEHISGGMIHSGGELIERIQRLASISFENIDLRLTASQLEELAHRAERQGKTVEDLVKEIWAKMSQDFFHTASVAE